MKRKVIGAVAWIINAWFWTFMLLGFFIPTFHTAEEERVHKAYVTGPNKPSIEEVDKAIEGSLLYTERITMLIAVPLAGAEYVLYLVIKSRRRKRHEVLAQTALSN